MGMVVVVVRLVGVGNSGARSASGVLAALLRRLLPSHLFDIFVDCVIVTVVVVLARLSCQGRDGCRAEPRRAVATLARRGLGAGAIAALSAVKGSCLGG